LVTEEILRQLPELEKLSVGMLNVFIKHTSASLTINENADPRCGRTLRVFSIGLYLRMNPTMSISMKVVTYGPY